jgi:hypothetical protein
LDRALCLSVVCSSPLAFALMSRGYFGRDPARLHQTPDRTTGRGHLDAIADTRLASL